MNNEKGFTLIELLAVIVVLIIILAIAVPSIINVIESSTKAAFLESCGMIAKQAEKKYLEDNMAGSSGKDLMFKFQDKRFIEQSNLSDLKVESGNIESGNVYVSNGKVALYLCGGKYCATKTFGNNTINLFESADKDLYIKTYNVGDQVILNDGSYWRVIGSENGKTKLFSQYVMKPENGLWVQDRTNTYRVTFDNQGARKPSNGNTYCVSSLGCSEYSANGTTVLNDSTIKTIADSYLNNLKQTNIVPADATIRLINKSELINLGCTIGANDSPGSCSSAPNYIKNAIYWTMTARNSVNTQDVWFVYNGSDFSYDCASRQGYGFRPIIEISNLGTYEINEIVRNNEKNGKPVATWMWENSGPIDPITDSNERKAKIKLLKEKGINTIYLAIEFSNTVKYKDFIAEANNNGIDIYYLTGDPGFINSSTHATTIYGRIDEIAAFNKAFSGVARIEGIHYDVEFYGFENDTLGDAGVWIAGESEAARRQERRIRFITFCRKAYEYAKKAGIFIEQDITPFTNMFSFYDTDGTRKFMSDEILKVSDTASLMAYGNGTYNTLYPIKFTGNYSFGDGSSVNVSKSYLSKFNDYGTKFVIGQDLEVFESTAAELAADPSLGPVYLPEYENPVTGKTDYAFTEAFVTRVQRETKAEVDRLILENNYNVEYGFAFHDYRYLIKLIETSN